MCFGQNIVGQVSICQDRQVCRGVGGRGGLVLIMHQMKLQHISIPLDELQLFKEEEKYQNYLVETLIYSTKVVLHNNALKFKSLLVITKLHLWLEDENNKKHTTRLPLTALLHLLKAEEHPELVFITNQAHDNLRISTASEQRCQNIISAIAFYCTYLAKQKAALRLYSIKQSSLLYFERTVKEKKSGPRVSFERYSCSLLTYVEPTDSPDLFGKVVIHKFLLTKQLYVEGSHLIHIALVNDQTTFLCHTLDKHQTLSQRITTHNNLESVQQLCYARALEYKLQLLFEFLPSLKPRSIKVTRLFEQAFRLYDVVRASTEGVGFVSYDMLLRQSEESGKLVLRQFRYRQLVCEWEYSRFVYVREREEKSEREYMVNKMFNMGVLMYEHMFGRAPFEHEDLQVSLQLSRNSQRIVFPVLQALKSSKRLQEFIQSCLLCKFQSRQQVKDHPWLTINKIQI